MLMIPFLDNSFDKYTTRLACISRSCFVNPSSGLSSFLTTSPSSSSTLKPNSFSLGSSVFAIVVLPEPGNPVSHITGEGATVKVEVVGVISRCISPWLQKDCPKIRPNQIIFFQCGILHYSVLRRVYLH